MKNIILYGASYPDPIKAIIASNKSPKVHHLNVVGFLDDIKHGKEKYFMEYPILGDITYLYKGLPCEGFGQFGPTVFVNNVHSSCSNRKKIAQRLHGLATMSIIHPSVDMTYVRTPGQNYYIGSGVYLGPNVVLYGNNSIRHNASIGHDTKIGLNSCVAPGATISGGVTIEDNVYVWSNAFIKQGVRVGENSIIGAGAVVLQDVPKGSTIVGNPGKQISKE